MVTKIIWDCLKKITKFKNVIKNVMKIYFPQIYRVSTFSWIQFLEIIKHIWYFRETEFKKVSAANCYMFVIAQLNFLNSRNWIQ